MKKSKKLIPLLLTLLVMLSLTTIAYADEAKNSEVRSGSKEAEVSFVIENVVALEGTVTTKKNVGFNVTKIDTKFTKDKKDETNWTDEVDQETDRVVVVGGSIPTSITVTVTLESSSPMKDGIYAVTLTYGKTNAAGVYSAGRKLVANIYVGIEDTSTTDGTSQSAGSTNKKPVVEQTPSTPNVTVTEKDDAEANRVGVMSALDTMALRSALAEAEELKNFGKLSVDELAMLCEAIDIGEEALQGDRQAVVDDATANLWAVIEELGGPVGDEEEEPDEDSSGGSKLLVPIILALVAVLGIAGMLVFRNIKKRVRADYEGAPIVDYEISDDDII